MNSNKNWQFNLGTSVSPQNIETLDNGQPQNEKENNQRAISLNIAENERNIEKHETNKLNENKNKMNENEYKQKSEISLNTNENGRKEKSEISLNNNDHECNEKSAISKNTTDEYERKQYSEISKKDEYVCKHKNEISNTHVKRQIVAHDRIQYNKLPTLHTNDNADGQSMMTKQIVVQGSFHQGDFRFGQNSGKQCVANCLSAVAYSKLKDIDKWIESYLDSVLIEGNDIYTRIHGDHDLLMMEDVPNDIKVSKKTMQIKKKIQSRQ